MTLIINNVILWKQEYQLLITKEHISCPQNMLLSISADHISRKWNTLTEHYIF